MLYFNGQVFRRLANQNRGHICVMLECIIYFKRLIYCIIYFKRSFSYSRHMRRLDVLIYIV